MAFPATYNFNYYRGDKFEVVVTPKTTGGAPYTVPTGFTPYLDIAKKRAASEASDKIYRAAAEMSVGRDSIYLVIPSSTGRNLAAGQSYVYDLEIYDSVNDVKYTLMTGSITVTDDVVGQ